MADKLQQIIDAMEPQIREAFLAAVADITSAAKLSAVVGHLEAGNIEAALIALNLREEFFGPLDDAIRRAHLEGGASMLAGLPALEAPFQNGAAVAVRFNGRHERAERAARDLSSRLITRVVEDQKEAVRLVIETGIREGWNPRKTALDIAGRVNRATGKREGGILGLNKQQADAVLRARAELADLSPDYFSRKLRDQRFDPLVKRAIRDGKPISAADVDRIATRYSDRLLKYRADTIARTETIASFNSGRLEGVRQLIDGGHMRPDQVTMVWDAAADARTRPSHMGMDGQRRRLGEPFATPAGYRMNHPGDATLGAPGSETIACRCVLRADIDFITGLK